MPTAKTGGSATPLFETNKQKCTYFYYKQIIIITLINIIIIIPFIDFLTILASCVHVQNLEFNTNCVFVNSCKYTKVNIPITVVLWCMYERDPVPALFLA